jgi:succinate dehydrogenase hydrophobic anchor subunit
VIRKAVAVLIMTVAWLLSAAFLVYAAEWSLAAISKEYLSSYEVRAAVNLLLVIASFAAFFILARRVLAEAKENDDLQ